MEQTRYSISYHIKDLLKRDPNTVREIANWLETRVGTKRDIDRRVRSRRLMARLIAARQLLAATEDTSAAKEVMDRTEGKVAQEVISYNGNELVKQLEAGRERLLQSRQPLQVVGSDAEGEIVTDSTALTALDSKTSK